MVPPYTPRSKATQALLPPAGVVWGRRAEHAPAAGDDPLGRDALVHPAVIPLVVPTGVHAAALMRVGDVVPEIVMFLFEVGAAEDLGVCGGVRAL